MIEVLQLHSSVAMGYSVGENFIISSDCDSNPCDAPVSGINSLVHDSAEYSVSLQQHKKSCAIQRKNLKSMLKQITKCDHKDKLGNKADKVSTQSNSATTAVFADILLGAGTDLVKNWESMILEEREVSASISTYRKKVVQELAQSTLVSSPLILHYPTTSYPLLFCSILP